MTYHKFGNPNATCPLLSWSIDSSDIPGPSSSGSKVERTVAETQYKRIFALISSGTLIDSPGFRGFPKIVLSRISCSGLVVANGD
jgi:hypothetical protein